MDDVEQQIKAWADASAPPVHEPLTAADVIGGRVAPTSELAEGAERPSWRGRWLAAAAVIVVVGAIGVALAMASDDDGSQQVRASDPPTTTSTTVADEPGTSVPVVPTDLPFDQLIEVSNGADAVGLAEAQSPAELATLWAELGLGSSRPAPDDVDFDRTVVVSLTIADDPCPPSLTSFRMDATIVEPKFTDAPGSCEDMGVLTTYVVALDWSDTGDEFLLVLAGRGPDDDQETLDVRRRSSTEPPEGSEPEREPAAGVTASLEVDTTEVPVGGTITGTLTVVNESGAPIEGTTCGDYFIGALGNDQFQQGIARTLCARDFTIPEGRSTYPISVQATVQGCTPVEVEDSGFGPRCNPDGSMPAMPTGVYELRIDDPDHLLPAVDPVTITVVPA